MNNYKEERKKDAENGHIHELISRKSIVTKDDKKPYVFISYSSKDWHKVLYEIVYKLCMDKGLRVYFDTKFDVGSDSWLKQFQKNMSDENCKAVLAFISPNYKTSYATLMELMSACENADSAQKTVLPICIGNAGCNNYDNTGLGTRRFPDYSTNDLWDKELELFNLLFNNLMLKSNDTISNKKEAEKMYPYSNKDIISYDSELDRDSVFKNEAYWELYGISKDDIDEKNKHWENLPDNEKTEKGKIYLNKWKNARLIEMILSGIDKNNIDDVNKSITDAVYAKLNALGYGDVFDKDLVESEEHSKYNVDIVNDENKNPIQVKDEEFVSNSDEEWHFSNPVHNDIEIYAKWKPDSVLPPVTINENTTLKEFDKLCEEAEFCILLGEARNKIRHGGKGLFDYLMAALLRGCDADIFDKKNNRIIKLSGYNYNKYAVAENPDDPKTSDIQYPWTWTTACRKSMKKEDIPERFINEKGKIKSGKLEDYNAIFEELRADMTIEDVLDKFKMKERGFDTKNNDLIFEAWELIKNINLVDVKKDLGELL